MIQMLKSFYMPGRIEAGCDEAGRGCLAGPVFAAAVILPPDFSHRDLGDSKTLPEKKRNQLRKIIEKEAISWAVSKVSPSQIDKINILNASIRGMHNAVKRLSVKPEFLLIDGNRFHHFPGIPHQCIIKGDSKYASIAAASILAKTHRDEYMIKKHRQYPYFGWDQNKGYPTPFHKKRLQIYGPSDLHRKSFRY